MIYKFILQSKALDVTPPQTNYGSPRLLIGLICLNTLIALYNASSSTTVHILYIPATTSLHLSVKIYNKTYNGKKIK